MSSKNINIFTDNKVCPETPLKLIKFTGIYKDGKIQHVLRLYGDLQEIKFVNSSYLIGRSITLHVPKHVYGQNDKLYKIDEPCGHAIKAQTLDGADVDVDVVSSENDCVYYINVAVSANMFDGCDLLLRFVKFELDLSDSCEEISCECKNNVCKNDWHWIASIKMD